MVHRTLAQPPSWIFRYQGLQRDEAGTHPLGPHRLVSRRCAVQQDWTHHGQHVPRRGIPRLVRYRRRVERGESQFFPLACGSTDDDDVA